MNTNKAPYAKKADVVIDLQYGSTGKGLLVGFLAATGAYDTVIASNMPNAGHTTITSEGRKWIHKALPNGIEVSKNIMIGPGSVFNPVQLAKEINEASDLLKGKKVYIHEAAGVLKPEHAEAERNTLSRIGSTMQGSAEALISKIRREPNAIVGADMELCAYLCSQNADIHILNQKEWLKVLMKADRILVEGSQGYSLGISAGFYPYCTSRECTASRVLADCGVPPLWVDKVFGVARLHPIRVGNTSDGTSGGCYPDQEETSWEALGLSQEFTTVTQRVRRVFSFSHEQFAEAVVANGCTDVLLNFVNYDPEYAKKVMEEIALTSGGYPIISLVGMGARNDEVVPADDFFNGLV